MRHADPDPVAPGGVTPVGRRAEGAAGYVFPPPPIPALEVEGNAEKFPIRRIYCLGRNYADHAREMGSDPGREPPFFFMKPADALVPGGGPVPYPPATRELHPEVELVVALGAGVVWGYAVGLDLTRRDLQAEAKRTARPWDMAKGFDRSAPCSALRPASVIGHPDSGAIRLSVNGDIRQESDLANQIWSVGEAIAHLSRLVELAPGDLLFTGTPAGVAAVGPGDRIDAEIEGVGALQTSIGTRGTGN